MELRIEKMLVDQNSVELEALRIVVVVAFGVEGLHIVEIEAEVVGMVPVEHYIVVGLVVERVLDLEGHHIAEVLETVLVYFRNIE
jgi:hypothetical protein